MLSPTWKHSGYGEFLKELTRVRRLRRRRLRQRYKYQTKIESLKKSITKKNKQRQELVRPTERELRALKRMSRKLMRFRRRRRWRRYRRMRIKQHALRKRYNTELAHLERVKHQLAKLKKERLRYIRLLRALRIPLLPKNRRGKRKRVSRSSGGRSHAKDSRTRRDKSHHVKELENKKTALGSGAKSKKSKKQTKEGDRGRRSQTRKHQLGDDFFDKKKGKKAKRPSQMGNNDNNVRRMPMHRRSHFGNELFSSSYFMPQSNDNKSNKTDEQGQANYLGSGSKRSGQRNSKRPFTTRSKKERQSLEANGNGRTGKRKSLAPGEEDVLWSRRNTEETRPSIRWDEREGDYRRHSKRYMGPNGEDLSPFGRHHARSPYMRHNERPSEASRLSVRWDERQEEETRNSRDTSGRKRPKTEEDEEAIKNKLRVSEEIREALQRYQTMRNSLTPQLDDEDNANSLANLPLKGVSVHTLLQNPRLITHLNLKSLLSEAVNLIKEKDLRKLLRDFKNDTANAQKRASAYKRDSESSKEDTETDKKDDVLLIALPQTLIRGTTDVDNLSEDWTPPEDEDSDLFAQLSSLMIPVQTQAQAQARSTVTNLSVDYGSPRPSEPSTPVEKKVATRERAKVPFKRPKSMDKGQPETKPIPKKLPAGPPCGMPCCKPDTDTQMDCCKFIPKLRRHSNSADDDDDDKTERMEKHHPG